MCCRADHNAVSVGRPVPEPHTGYQGDGSVRHRLFRYFVGTSGLVAELRGAPAPGAGIEDLQALHKADGRADKRYQGTAARV